MLRKRIIFTLIYADGFFNQSRNFRLQKVGDINWLEKNYKLKEIAFSIDELIIINASREKKDIDLFSKELKRIVNSVFIPITAGEQFVVEWALDGQSAHMPSGGGAGGEGSSGDA